MSTENIHNRETKLSCVCVAGACFTPDVLVQYSFGSHSMQQWGLLITFIELIKNQRYQFWKHEFTHCATEIEKVFESVARSCMSPASATEVGGDINQ